MQRKNYDRTFTVVITAMFAAMIAVSTAFLKIQTPTAGYVHLGDAFLYLCACFLPTPYAVFAASVGSGIADLLVYPQTLIYTVIIKAVNALFFSNKGDKILTKRNAIMVIPSGLVTVLGYSLSKFIRMKLSGATNIVAFTDAVWKIPENAIQAVCSAVVFFAVAYAFDKADIKKRMLK